MNILRHCASCPSRIDSVFEGLEEATLQELNNAKTTNRYDRGQKLFYEGNDPTGLFCVADGQIKLFKTGQDGKEVILRIAGPGAIIGFRGMLTAEPYPATAQVLKEAVVCFVDKAFINTLLKRNADLAFRIMRRLIDEITKAENRLSDIANKNVRERLSQLLIALETTYGVPEKNNGSLLNVKLTRADLASMVGATPETVIRLLSDFKDLGYVELRGKQILLKNRNDLLQEANLDT